jgi:hypothetical protein
MTWGLNWQTLMWIAWAFTFLGVVITWWRVRDVHAHQSHHCQMSIVQGLALAHLLATLDDAGIVLPEPLRGIAEAFRRGEHDALEDLLADLDRFDLDDADEDEGGN